MTRRPAESANLFGALTFSNEMEVASVLEYGEPDSLVAEAFLARLASPRL